MEKYEIAQKGRRPASNGGLAERYAHVVDGIGLAARRATRSTADVTLIAISKTYPAADIVPLLDLGHRVYGENRVQEAQEKWPELKAQYPDTQLHLVGQLQSNKAEDAVALFDAIHSVDRPSLIAALAKAGEKTGRMPQLFIQVNIGDEPQKGGCATADLPALLDQARSAGLSISGLMCIPPSGTEAAPYFALLRKLARENDLSALSMGMSDDYDAAVMTGTTHVRVGSAIFGPRD